MPTYSNSVQSIYTEFTYVIYSSECSDYPNPSQHTQLCVLLLWLSTHLSAIEPEGSDNRLVVSLHRLLPGFQQGYHFGRVCPEIQICKICVYYSSLPSITYDKAFSFNKSIDPCLLYCQLLCIVTVLYALKLSPLFHVCFVFSHCNL